MPCSLTSVTIFMTIILKSLLGKSVFSILLRSPSNDLSCSSVWDIFPCWCYFFFHFFHSLWCFCTLHVGLGTLSHHQSRWSSWLSLKPLWLSPIERVCQDQSVFQGREYQSAHRCRLTRNCTLMEELENNIIKFLPRRNWKMGSFTCFLYRKPRQIALRVGEERRVLVHLGKSCCFACCPPVERVNAAPLAFRAKWFGNSFYGSHKNWVTKYVDKLLSRWY